MSDAGSIRAEGEHSRRFKFDVCTGKSRLRP